jgi:hypothetical protein
MAECKTEEYEEYMRRQKEKEKPKKDENKELLDLVWDIDEKGENLTPWEVNFIGDLVDKKVKRFTPKQAKQIRRVAEERIP